MKQIKKKCFTKVWKEIGLIKSRVAAQYYINIYICMYVYIIIRFKKMRKLTMYTIFRIANNPSIHIQQTDTQDTHDTHAKMFIKITFPFCN